MEEHSTKDKVREIKQSFRLLMNGVTAQSMRDKGVDYHVNWGASLPHLREMAAEYEPNKALAQELWKEDVRECKILATMLMPPAELDRETAMQWIGQTRTQEIAEIAAINLYQHLPFAAEIAVGLICEPLQMAQLHGFTILSRLFSNGIPLNGKEEESKFLEKAVEALAGGNIPLRHSAWNAVIHFSGIDDASYTTAKNALRATKMDDWL